jgi:hypothetical protein
MEDIFTHIYENHKWGDNQCTEYKGSSGPGSEIEYNQAYIQFLKTFILDHTIKSVVDLGCGDFRYGVSIYEDLEVRYTGYDAYQKMVKCHASHYDSPKYTFRHLEFSNHVDKIESGDLCILKDVLQHWRLEKIYLFLDALIESKKFKYILICNCCYQSKDNTTIRSGDFHFLSCDYLPLKKYNPVKVFHYHSKEVCIIDLSKRI